MSLLRWTFNDEGMHFEKSRVLFVLWSSVRIQHRFLPLLKIPFQTLHASSSDAGRTANKKLTATQQPSAFPNDAFWQWQCTLLKSWYNHSVPWSWIDLSRNWRISKNWTAELLLMPKSLLLRLATPILWRETTAVTYLPKHQLLKKDKHWNGYASQSRICSCAGFLLQNWFCGYVRRNYDVLAHSSVPWILRTHHVQLASNQNQVLREIDVMCWKLAKDWEETPGSHDSAQRGQRLDIISLQ